MIIYLFIVSSFYRKAKKAPAPDKRVSFLLRQRLRPC